MNGKRAVLYLRLSKEDLHKIREGDDSASIKNQRLMLMEYALAMGYQITDVCDRQKPVKIFPQYGAYREVSAP